MSEWRKLKSADLWSGLVLVILSGLVIQEAFELEVGTPTNPGSGFMVFGAAVALALLALRQFVTSFRSRACAMESVAGADAWGPDPRRDLGHRPLHRGPAACGLSDVTFLLLSFLFQVLERGHWALRTIGAASTAFVTYVIFAKMLQLNLPKGLITFY